MLPTCYTNASAITTKNAQQNNEIRIFINWQNVSCGLQLNII